MNKRVSAQIAAITIAVLASGCGPTGPSLKQQADERAAASKARKQQEEFTKSLPPTQGKPVYRP